MRVLGVPFDGGGAKLGSRLGSPAVRLAGLQENLALLGHKVTQWTELDLYSYDESVPGLRNFAALFKTLQKVKEFVKETVAGKEFPIVVGGEHSIALGSVAGAIAGRPDETWAVLWIDAHADINTPATSGSGNLHGMPLAALAQLESGVAGEADAQWKKLVALASPGIPVSQIGWIGLRDVDLGERRAIHASPKSPAVTMHDIDLHGIQAAVSRADVWLREIGATRLWISFDVDAMDPILAPGTGTAVRGGLSYREAHLLAELLREALAQEACPYKLGGLDIVEVNPLEDTNNQTAKMAVEWAASLFGKTILGVPGGI